MDIKIIEQLNKERKKLALDFQPMYIYFVKSEIIKLLKEKNVFFKEELNLIKRKNIKEKNYEIDIVTDSVSIYDIRDILNENKEKLNIDISNIALKKGNITFLANLSIHRAEFSIHMENRKEIRYIEKRTFYDFVLDKDIEYNIFQSEELVVLFIIEILSKMEFCNDMDVYFKLYNILGESVLDGRKLMSIFTKKTENDDKFNQKRLELKFSQFEKFKDNKYLKQNWNRYTRKIKGVSWEEAYNRIYLFISPIIKNYLENTIFIDSWMPELQRFLG